MSFAIPILGGIGLFLVGVWMMTEGLKLAAGGLLQRILASATSSPLRGLAAGIFITALVRSSSAVTVATIGFVNAGLMALAPAVWVVFGTNLGTTTTAWLVVLAGTGFDAATMALPLVGIGMILRLVGANRQRTAGLAGYRQLLPFEPHHGAQKRCGTRQISQGDLVVEFFDLAQRSRLLPPADNVERARQHAPANGGAEGMKSGLWHAGRAKAVQRHQLGKGGVGHLGQSQVGLGHAGGKTGEGGAVQPIFGQQRQAPAPADPFIGKVAI